jgi:hypothetical protein
MLHERASLGSKLLLVAGLIVYALLSYRSLAHNNQRDFFIYRLGTRLALAGDSPYDAAKLRQETAEVFPATPDDTFAENCGFFLTPQAIAIFYPFASADWDIAQSMWFLTLSLCATLSGTLAFTFGRREDRQGVGWAIIAVVVLLNPITQPSLVVGQTTLLVVGCLALGQYAFETDCPRLGCFLWAIPFFKPHLMPLFFILAVLLGGWKRAAGIGLFVVGLHLLGGLLATGAIRGAIALNRDYLDYVGAAHKAVVYNLVEENYQIPSWNRLLFVLGGPALNLRVPMILAGDALWVAMLAIRLRGRLPGPAFLVAAAAVGTLTFTQVLAYEMLLLAFLAPLILQLFDAGRRGDAWTLIAFLVFLLVPLTTMDHLANAMNLPVDSRLRLIMLSHKCAGMTALAIWLAARARALTTTKSLRQYPQPTQLEQKQ